MENETRREEAAGCCIVKEIGVNTEDTDSEEMVKLVERINELEEEVNVLQIEVSSGSKMRLSTVSGDDSKVHRISLV